MTFFIHSGEGEEPMTALDAERLAQGTKKNGLLLSVLFIIKTFYKG